MSTTQTVRASVLHGAKDLQVEERPLPPPAPHEVHVAIKSTGLCGSDLHYFTHFRNGDIQVRQPLTLGHESAGVVTAVGSGVTHLRPGDPVALEVGLPCGGCALCAAGRYNICREMRFRSSAKGSLPHAQGTLQEVIAHPAAYAHRLPEGVGLELGALAEPLGVALHAGDRAGLGEAGATVLVFGAGAVGLLCCAVSKAVSRARRVVVADVNGDRVRWALERGFADAGVVATKPGGKIMIIGMGNPIQTLPISAASLKEVDLVGVFRYANTYPRVIELLSSKNPLLPPVEELITHRYKSLDSIPEAFNTAGKVKDDEGNLVLKVMVDF
ncbi:hypothetical protein VPNG_07346 [Cytospora leucostoma]|uniref:Enoyl reductase (ER) domain-containing protein n=1 Tax=Cytospora leucostoma TaxID=1230097 RepID=A0A423WUE9_9PEZI|nr:hypothetical protein VPNG_07346 [Cytospora leucostoma]